MYMYFFLVQLRLSLIKSICIHEFDRELVWIVDVKYNRAIQVHVYRPLNIKTRSCVFSYLDNMYIFPTDL